MKFDLEERLIKFAVLILDIYEKVPENRAAEHLANQLIRSATSPALCYGEAQAAESRKDFIHKMAIALKEMRESLACLKIIHRRQYLKPEITESAITELNELISIFVKSIQTAKANLKEEIEKKLKQNHS